MVTDDRHRTPDMPKEFILGPMHAAIGQTIRNNNNKTTNNTTIIQE